MEEASDMMDGLNSEQVLQGLVQVKQHNTEEKNFRLVADYSMLNLSDNEVRIILSYTNYIKRVILNKNY
jgi:hypothetical protein